MKKKKFRLVDAILSTVCITLVAESVMPTAAIGNTQYFWWILLLVFFCVPYGMIAAELGTSYQSEAGIYDWVKRAFGKKWAGRVAWNYWINFPLWISSLATAITTVLASLFDVTLAWWLVMIIQLVYIALVTFLGTKRVGESKAVVNIGTIFKVVLLAGIGALGFIYYFQNGSANPVSSFKDLIPFTGDGTFLERIFDLDAGLPFISIIIFNFLGFEVVGTFVNDMDDPKKDIPKALVIGGLFMAVLYVLPATGFNFVLGGSEVDPSDFIAVLDGVFTSLGLYGGILNALLWMGGLMLIYTFIANIASWSFGVDAAAEAAAQDGTMPAFFKGTNKEGVAANASIANGVVAAIISVAGIIIGELSESFSASFSLFFNLSWITLLFSYAPMFLAFLKLRRVDANTERAYKVPGSKGFVKLMGIVPFVLLILGIMFTLFGDFSVEYMADSIPLYVGVAASFIVEEILVARIKK